MLNVLGGPTYIDRRHRRYLRLLDERAGISWREAETFRPPYRSRREQNNSDTI